MKIENRKMKLLIKNGHIVDPANNRNEVCDILLEGARILKVGKGIDCAKGLTIDAAGKIVMPGLVDMHVHLRQPGREDRETVATASAAALKGGITSLLAMSNTTPPMDCAGNIDLLKAIIKKDALVDVFIAGTITKERKGKSLTDIAKLKKRGAVAISDDGASVDNSKVLLTALKKAKENKLLVICHSEDKMLAGRGVVNLGSVSTRMGLRGVSCESEYRRVQRDLKLAQEAKARIHIAHVSCKESVEIIAAAKKKGVKATAETAPHYFALSQEAVLGFDTNVKMNPPLRAKEDVKAIRQGLKDGTIDAIASDHAPHTESEKDIEFERAEFGVIGLETELAVSISELVEPGILGWMSLVRKLSANPAKILGIKKGSLSPGCDADIIVVSPQKEWLVEKDGFLSKSKNSAFIGKRLRGVVEYTIRGGQIVYS